MRHKPSLTYSGLTIVLSNPSRFDQYELISGVAGHYMWTECICNIDRKSIDIRTADTINLDLLPNTKALLLLGEKAFKDWSIGYSDYSLNEQRGSPLENRWKIPCIASYLPQDAMDIVDYEKKLNPLANHEDEEQENDEDETEFETKRKNKTKRSNYRFWLKKDTEKIYRATTKDFVLSNIQAGHLDVRLAPP